MSAPRDKPWIFRTYAGHSSAAASNALYRTNLAKGQTGLSVAFDLPTQTGYDSDHPLAKGEVGKVGVPIGHLGDMRALFDGLPLAKMNTSMTINAPAAWLLALYIAVADEQGAPRAALQGTTQNDIIKEYLARGTYIFPPKPALRLTTDTIAFTTAEMPKWNPINLCSYHLQEAGADAVEEAGFALAAAIAVLDAAKARGAIPSARISQSRRPHQLLRQFGREVHHRDLQAARDGGDLGRDRAKALRRRGSEAAPLPLWRAGELAGADRAAAGKQRLSHPLRHAGRDAVEECARPRRAAAGVERSARPAASVGPAMVAPAAADRRLRNRHAGIRRHLRRLACHRSESGGTGSANPRRDRAHRSHGRRRLAGSARIYERAAGALQCGTRRSHRDGRRDPRRRQRLSGNRTFAADRRQRQFRRRRRKRRARSDRAARSLAARTRCQSRGGGALPISNARRGKVRTSCRRRSPAPRPA